MPTKTLDLRDKHHPSEELPSKINRDWHLYYTNDKNRDECKALGKQLKDRMTSLMSNPNAEGLGDLPEKLRDCGLKRAFHDELGVRKVVLTFCDDMLTTVYNMEATWKLFEKELNAIFKLIGVNPKHVIRCLFAELGPGVSIPVHHDTGYWATRSHRVHIPLITNKLVEFFTGKTEKSLVHVPFPEFEIIELNNRAKHMVNNTWDKPRVHLIFDFVEDHIVENLKFETLRETDIVTQTRRTIKIIREGEEKDQEPSSSKPEIDELPPIASNDEERKVLTNGLFQKIREAHMDDELRGNRLVNEFIKNSKRYSDGEMQAGEYVRFLDLAFLNRDSAKSIVLLLHDRERAAALKKALDDVTMPKKQTMMTNNRPFFVVAGAMKCGTTSLYEYINQHPDCVRARQKEPHAFDWIWNSLCNLPGENLQEKYMKAFQIFNDPVKFTGEATPSYLLGGTEVLKRLQAACPYAKILIILRNPVERAWSHYRMTLDSKGATPDQISRRGTVKGKTFQDVIEDDLEALSNCEINALKTIASEFESSYLSALPSGHGAHSYVGRGLYALQIELLLQVFPREQIMFLTLDDLSKDVKSKMNQVFEFLQVKPCEVVGEKHNEGENKVIKSNEDLAALEKLKNYYLPHNQRLAKLIPEIDISNWMKE